MMLKGIVFRVNNTNEGVYLSLLNPQTNTITNGLPIDEGEYSILEENQVCTVQVCFQDGNYILKDDIVLEFLNGERMFEAGNIFYRIRKIMVFGFPLPIKKYKEEEIEYMFNDVINRTNYN